MCSLITFSGFSKVFGNSSGLLFFLTCLTLGFVLDSACSAIWNKMTSENDSAPSTSRGPAAAIHFDTDESFVKRRMYSSEVLGGWNLKKVIIELGTRHQCVAFAEQHNLVLTSKECRVHRQPMRIDMVHDNNVGSFVCNKGTCRTMGRISRANGTWFEKVKIDLSHIFYLMHCFAHHWLHEKVIWEDILKDEKEHCLSSAIITDWYSYCREAVVIYQLEKEQSIGKIGGPGKVVQIDESKFGRRKYNRGRRFEGYWVLGMIEDGNEDLRLEVCPDIRLAEVLVPLIKKHVMEDTTIHTDFWRAYGCLGDHGFIHKKVNYSDPENRFVAYDGTHTLAGSQWRVVKRFFYKDNYNHLENFAGVIVEFVWRRSINKNKRDPFVELLEAVKHR